MRPAYERSGMPSSVWKLRRNVTSYDAWYVAVAEGFGLPLATSIAD
jgi:predicted nucleic acid-binding protein